MVTHMKTTIEIADDLFLRSKDMAQKQGRTFRAFIEEAIEQALRQYTKTKRFWLKPVTVTGYGLRKELHESPWSAIRDLAYAYDES